MYAGAFNKGKELDIDLCLRLSDEQVKELLDAGFRFRHKTLEERLAQYEGVCKPVKPFDWGEPVGREIDLRD